LSGSVPAKLGNLSSLTSLSLRVNELSGSIPPEIGNLDNLVELELNSNQLSGSIPPEIGNLGNLVELELSSNQLSGSIPVELGNLPNLTYIRLESNLLSGPLPQSLTDLNLVSLFYFNDTALCEPPDADFQEWLTNIDNLQSTGVICAVSELPGDCNGNETAGSADITGVVLELFDGDGSDPAEAANGTFVGTTGCDANEDGTISAADITCVVLIIFNGPGSCGLQDTIVRIGETSSTDYENVSLTFLGVTEDSRCPSDVLCVWEGQATVRVNVVIDGEDQGDISLTAREGHDDLDSQEVGGYLISLVRLDPYPVSTEPIPPEDYKAEVKVSQVGEHN